MKSSIFFKENIQYDHIINRICNDSRKCQSDDVFYCTVVDIDKCNAFISEAIKKGSKTVVLSTELLNKVTQFKGINYIYDDDIKIRLCDDLYKMYKYIFKRVKVYTCCGTNGKTTVTSLLYKYLRSNNIKCSLVGTNGNYVNDKYYKTNNTTDDICIIYELLKESYEQNVKYFIMEASSHAIKGLRIKNIPVELTVFTNLTLDHLDYHKTMDDYKYTKLLHLKDSKKVILNSDDDTYWLYKRYLDNYKTFGRSRADYLITNERLEINKSVFNLKINYKDYYDNFYFTTNLLGGFNIDNVTCFIACLCEMGFFNYGKVYSFLKTICEISGRMEHYIFNNIHFYIDFAHTPDGVENVLKYLNSIKHNKLVTVIGCGGSRDKLKRKSIGEVSSELSDYAIYTTDNPRDEDEEEIIKQIASGAKNNNFTMITSRKEAIQKAISICNDDDIVAILGKGNEDYILKKNVKIPYNDKEYLFSLYKEEL